MRHIFIHLAVLILTSQSCIAIASEYVLQHDPFARKPSTANHGRSPDNATSELELKAVILDGEDSIANINGNYIKLNQSFSGHRVTRIERGMIELERNGNRTTLRTSNYEK